MSSRQTVVLASRVICVFLLYFACADLSYLPGHILGALHWWRVVSNGSVTGLDRYFLRSDSLGLEAVVARLAVELFFAGVFYRCGDRIARFLLGGEPTTSRVSESSV